MCLWATRGQLIQTGLSQVALLHLYPVFFVKGGKQSLFYSLGWQRHKRAGSDAQELVSPLVVPHSLTSLAKVNPAKLKVKLWGNASHPWEEGRKTTLNEIVTYHIESPHFSFCPRGTLYFSPSDFSSSFSFLINMCSIICTV